MGEYKLRMNDAVKQMQMGLGDILYNKSFLDSVISCSDGVLHHSRLTVSLMFPELADTEIFNFPIQQTLLLPDHSMAQIQELVENLFSSDAKLPNNVTQKMDVINENEIELIDDTEHVDDYNTMESDSVYSDSDEIYARNKSNYYESDEKDYITYGYHNPKSNIRGSRRGRPPLGNRNMPERFRCDVCDKGFYYNSMLTQHMKTHTGGIPRETCPKCGVEYATRQILKAHMIRYHGADSFVSRPRGRPPGRSRAHKVGGSTSGSLKLSPNSNDSVWGGVNEDMEPVGIKQEIVDTRMITPIDNSNDINETKDDINDDASHSGDVIKESSC